VIHGAANHQSSVSFQSMTQLGPKMQRCIVEIMHDTSACRSTGGDNDIELCGVLPDGGFFIPDGGELEVFVLDREWVPSWSSSGLKDLAPLLHPAEQGLGLSH
jgi:hypothetical protein